MERKTSDHLWFLSKKQIAPCTQLGLPDFYLIASVIDIDLEEYGEGKNNSIIIFYNSISGK